MRKPSVFTARRHASAVYAVVVSVCHKSGVLLKRLNVGSRVIPRYLSRIHAGTLAFWCRRSWQNLNEITPQWRRQMVG